MGRDGEAVSPHDSVDSGSPRALLPTPRRVAERSERMHWTVATPFTLDPASDRWLTPFVPGEHRRFTMVPAQTAPSWHERSHRAAGLGEWRRSWNQGRAAWRESRGGVVTVFPQLAFVVGLHQRLALRHKPVVAWCFNLGGLYGGARRAAARAAFSSVERFVVHSRAEIGRYSEWLGLPRERFRFVPLQRRSIPIVAAEEEGSPFVLALGSAHRDFATLFEAVRRARLPTLVVAARHALNGLRVPSNVELQSSLSHADCRHLAQRARVNVVPVMNEETASGQVTLVEAMRMGRAVVATRCIGSEDYITSGSNGLLVEPRSVEDLQEALERVWEDARLRRTLGRNAAEHSAKHCSDEAAGIALAQVLEELELTPQNPART